MGRNGRERAARPAFVLLPLASASRRPPAFALGESESALGYVSFPLRTMSVSDDPVLVV